MKLRAFLVPALAVLVTVSPEGIAWADSKQECAAAADTGQSARDQGRYHAAHEAFVSCAREVCPRIIAQMCGGWLREIDAGTPTLVLGAKDASGGDLTDVHVTLDGAPFSDRLDGKPLPIDPGAHTIRFARDGYEPGEQRVVARSGEKNRLVVMTLKSTRGDVVASPPASGPAPEDSSSSSTARLATGITLFTLAAASGGAGAFFVIRSNHDSSNAAALRSGMPSSACSQGSSATCTALANDVDARQREALAAGVLFGGAGALAIAGAATLLLWPRHDDHLSAWVAPSFVVGGGTLNVLGSF